MQVIGVGHCRTGTKSLKTALDQLGYKTYHMIELINHPDTDVFFWNKAFDHTCNDSDWIRFFDQRKYNATTDYPAALFWEELFKIYPHAKFILTVRDPESWYASTKEVLYDTKDGLFMQLLNCIFGGPYRLNQTVHRYQSYFFHNKFKDKKYAIERFNQHNQAVRNTIPQSQLLVMSIQDGWQPLCTFLGHDVPIQSFPKVNERNDLLKVILIRKRQRRLRLGRNAFLVVFFFALVLNFFGFI